jgi:hypothetical protein
MVSIDASAVFAVLEEDELEVAAIVVLTVLVEDELEVAAIVVFASLEEDEAFAVDFKFELVAGCHNDHIIFLQLLFKAKRLIVIKISINKFNERRLFGNTFE